MRATLKPQNYEFIYAVCFSIAVLLFLTGFLVLGLTHGSAPFILGSEMNADGTVEYLCLGARCDNLNKMDW